MLSSNHVIVSSSQEPSSPALPQTVVILPPGTTFQLSSQRNLSPTVISSSPRPLQHVLPKSLASATFQRAPAPSLSSPSKGNSSLVSSSTPPIGSSISSVKFCFPDTLKVSYVQSDSNKLSSTPNHGNSDGKHFQYTSAICKPTQTSTTWNHTQASTSSSPVVASSEPTLVSSTSLQAPRLSTRMILRRFLSRRRKRNRSKPRRSHVTALVRRSITYLNRMHVMEECDKSEEMVAESAPDLVSTKTTDIKLVKEDFSISKDELLPTKEELKIPSLTESEVKCSLEEEKHEASKPLVNGDVKEGTDSSRNSESGVKSVENGIFENGKDSDGERTKTKQIASGEEKEDTKERVKEAEVREGGSGAASEEEDRNSVTSSQSRKRAAQVEAEGEGENSSSESDAGSKRARLDNDDGEDERERLVREYVEECTENMEDMSRAADKLQREIGALGELLRAKELEWNSILRLRKLKEEMLERLLRRRRLAALLTENGVKEEFSLEREREKNINKGAKVINLNSLPNNNMGQLNQPGPGSMMMVPIVSSSPGPGPMPRGPPRMPQVRMQRPILPKPGPDQNSIVGEGRQGAILDVKSLIADYRSRHPENVPRRGRRFRPHEPGGLPRGLSDNHNPPHTRISGSPALMSMANMALGSGSHVRENPPYMGQDSSRPSSADSSRGHMEMIPNPGLSFKDALVQFAKMSQPPKPPPPPPPYPEVTLHPVSPPPPHSSLLHGILTKSGPANMSQQLPPQPHRATTFSPTLARLLTAPERAPPTSHVPTSTTASHFRPPAARASIGEIISSSKKNRNEITITPVSGSNKTKEDIVILPEEDDEVDGDRLVIDEGRDNVGNSELPENVPECQGCHQRSAQFVCAGCGNQWYCSRECQVSAWEEHSEMCSG